MKNYIAIIRCGESPGYSVDFPDFPGCASAGDTLEEARVSAMDALAMHVEGMMEDGDPIPDPSSLDDVYADKDQFIYEDAAAVVYIPLLPQKDKRERINISIHASALKEIDTFVESSKEEKNRSMFLERAAFEKMMRDGWVTRTYTYKRKAKGKPRKKNKVKS